MAEAHGNRKRTPEVLDDRAQLSSIPDCLIDADLQAPTVAAVEFTAAVRSVDGSNVVTVGGVPAPSTMSPSESITYALLAARERWAAGADTKALRAALIELLVRLEQGE